MPIGVLARGTDEIIRVTQEDRSELVTDLSTSSPTFTVKDSAGADKVTDASASATGLVISVPLDTNVGGMWAAGEYRLYVKFTVGGEVVRKGPYYFTLVE